MKPEFRFARDGGRLVWVEYGPEEYRAFWGGDAEEYLDFLAAVTRSCKELSDGCLDRWVVRVPFDLKDYAAWARENPEEAAGPEAHLAWAVQAARSPERLASLRARHRHRCSVPADELFKAETVVWCLPVVVHGPEEARRLASPLPPALLEEVVEGLFTDLWRDAVPFRRLSPRRALGFAAVPGDRLIPAARTREVDEAAEKLAAQMMESLPSSFAVPAGIRITPPRSYPSLELLGLPFLLLGSEVDVEVGLVLAQFHQEADLPLAAWERFFGELEVAFLGEFARHFFPGHYGPEFFEDVVKEDIRLKRATKDRSRQGRLRRVK